MYLRLEICGVCGEFLESKEIFFFVSIQMIIYICKTDILKLRFKTVLSVNNIYLNLFGLVKNNKWILCSLKSGVKCAY